MKNITIKNQEILAILNEFKDLWYSDIDFFEKNTHAQCAELKDVRENYINDEYKQKIIDQGSSHDGFPEALYGYSLKDTLPSDQRADYNNESLAEAKSDFYFKKRYLELNEKLSATLGTYYNALCSVYPPGGFISWHNNANASAYNVIFTWSETGDGYWKHIDPETKEEVVVPDVPGWQCKSFYFGAYDDPTGDPVYHMASTDCWRMTISYIFDRENVEWWEDCLEEIETPD